MVRVVQRCTNAEDAKGNDSICAEYIAEILEEDKEITPDIWGQLVIEDREIAEAVVACFNYEYRVNKSLVLLDSALDLVKLERAGKDKAARVSEPVRTPYGYYWWFWKGRADHRTKFVPQFPRVNPYMDGWNSVEDDDQSAHSAQEPPRRVDILLDAHPDEMVAIYAPYNHLPTLHGILKLKAHYVSKDPSWRCSISVIDSVREVFPSPEYHHSEEFLRQLEQIDCGF